MTKILELVAIDFLSAAGSHTGLKRTNNEDRFIIDANHGVFSVIDGMGGHAAGDVAANIAVETIQTAIRRINNSAEVRLRDSIVLANNNIYDKSREDENLQGMGCVLTAVLIENEVATVAHIGDTRLYKIQDNKIEKLTTDHSPVGDIEENGELSEIGLMRHPRRNEVSRCLGMAKKKFDEKDFIDVFQTGFSSATGLLLCSDGLSDLLTSENILEIVRENAASPSDVVENLIAAANEAGGKDNITVVFIAGRNFSQTIADAHSRKTSFRRKFIAATMNRWAFLFYGLLMSGLFALVYFLGKFSSQVNVSPF